MPKVFVSYSHEEPEHNQWVMELAADLRKNGVDASLDKWDLKGGQDLTLFMESQIRDSDFVILICTPVYAQKSNVPRGGVGYEKNIISAEMLQASDLKPKFIPVLRKGNHESLPTYLGSKFAIDFRESGSYKEALEELLRNIYDEPHPKKPPLGERPIFISKEKEAGFSNLDASVTIVKPYYPDVDIWEKEALGRFEFLCKNKISATKKNPFMFGYWQASFVLFKKIRNLDLSEFLKILRAAETNRTGWDIGWVPTREGIAPYPYKNGIEVWLAEDGDKKPGHSDFWRAEPSGKFSLFRGYQEDGIPEFQPGQTLDFGLHLWRISEILLYIESFSEKMGINNTKAAVKITWKGLGNRKIGTHNPLTVPIDGNYVCHQDEIISKHEIENCKNIKNNLIHDVYNITKPLFEAFDFFSVSEQSIKNNIKKLFDADKETN